MTYQSRLYVVRCCAVRRYNGTLLTFCMTWSTCVVCILGSALRQAIVTVARNAQLVPNWHGLCSLLSLTADDITDIETRHPTSATDRCYDSLVRWTQAPADDGYERSVPALIQLLRCGQYHQMAGMTSLTVITEVRVLATTVASLT